MRILAILLVWFFSAMAFAAPPRLDGHWEDRVSCPGNICMKNNGLGPDEFVVNIVTKGDVVCGDVSSSVMNYHRTDQSLFLGTIRGEVATVQFESTWGEEHRRGTAILSVHNGKLRWHIKEKISGAYTWANASAKRVRWDKDDGDGLLSWCSSHWDDIRTGNTGRIELLK